MRHGLLIFLSVLALACPAWAVPSPGCVVGMTTNPYGSGSQRKRICLDTQHGVHVNWIYRYARDPNTSRGYYNFRDEMGSWAFGRIGTAHDPRTGRMGSLTILSDGRAVPTSHVIGTPLTCVSVDAMRGAGAFTSFIPDSGNPTNKPYWPAINTCGGDVLICFGTDGDTGGGSGDNEHYVTRSTNDGQTWSTWTKLSDAGIGGGWFAGTAKGTKAAIAWPDSLAYNVWIRESTDSGLTWGPRDTVFYWSVSDSVYAWHNQEAVYDFLGNLHLVFEVRDTTHVTTRSQIWHWSKATGLSVVTSGWWVSQPGSGLLSVSWPSLGQNPRTGYWYCVWQEFTLQDTSTLGISNGEIFAAFSTNNGLSWSPKSNLTRSATPDSPPGRCADDRYPSLASVVPDSLFVLYLAGLQDTSGMIPDTVRVHIVPVDSLLGVESEPIPKAALSLPELRIVPNPARGRVVFSYSVPYTLHPTPYTLSLFDLSGRRVKSFPPHALRLTPHEVVWDGRNDEGKPVSSGVYFVRLEAGSAALTRRLVLAR